MSLNLFGAWLLEKAAALPDAGLFVVSSLVLAVIIVNIGRIVIWNFVHRRYSLSRSYPLTAMFFPLVALMSWWQGETLSPAAIFGVVLITAGVVWYALMVPEQQ